MKLDELAFVNRQLAGMLRDGLPLEGALRATVRELGSPAWQTEFGRLEAELSQGVPLGEAIERRAFPAVYRRLVRVGAAGGDLPAALVAAADHFEAVVQWRRRMQAVLVYPAFVLAVGVGVCGVLAWLQGGSVAKLGVGTPGLWLPWLVPVTTGLVLAVWLLILGVPGWRRWVSWRLPGWRDVRVAQVADTLAVLLRYGCPIPEALSLVRELEADSPAGAELAVWQTRLAGGVTRFAEVAGGDSLFPGLFRWLVAQSGDRWDEGFAAAARFYRERARYRFDLLLHGALPVSLLLLGFLIVQQFAPLFLRLIRMVDLLGSDGGGL